MLRNVDLTGPYGHAGQFAELDRFIDHYSENADKLRAYGEADIPEALLRGTLLTGNVEAIIDARDPLILPVVFDENVVRLLTAYMSALTDANAAVFDAAHGFAGCIPGIHEVLRRQGLLRGTWCLDVHETLSPGQREELDRVARRYPFLMDDAFVAAHRDER